MEYTISVGRTSPLTKKVSKAMGQIFDHMKGSEIIVSEILGTIEPKTKSGFFSRAQIKKIENGLLKECQSTDKSVCSIRVEELTEYMRKELARKED